MSDVAPTVSIIIPTLNEEASLPTTLKNLAQIRGHIETIVADGGSSDRTVEIAIEHGVQVVTSKPGRGLQMYAGARVARGETLLFLHSDALVPVKTAEEIDATFARDPAVVGGNCKIRFDGNGRATRFMTWLYPKLAQIGLRYGDSGIFVRASVYKEIGGFKPFPIFEDIDFVRRLRKRGRIVDLPVELVASARRFEGRRFPAAFARWTILQVLYWLGVPPEKLGNLYRPVRIAQNSSGAATVGAALRGRPSFETQAFPCNGRRQSAAPTVTTADDR